ncbi:hypothetical protein CPC08DRAFT_801849 [Agrocybe pediades]|nr:hypothetical protein CPC08DRAFT_801849 [Agrocybe pediades]
MPGGIILWGEITRYEVDVLRRARSTGKALNVVKKRISPRTFVEAMEVTANRLQEASIIVGIPPGVPFRNDVAYLIPPSLTMRNLTRLFLHIENLDMPPKFLKVLRMPALEVLEIRNGVAGQCRPWDLSIVTAVITGSECELETHSLWNVRSKTQRACSDMKARSALPCREIPVPENERAALEFRMSQQDNDLISLLRAVPDLQILRLPLNVPLRAASLALIGTGELVPGLMSLKAGFLQKGPLLDMLRRRNGILRSHITQSIPLIYLTALVHPPAAGQALMTSDEVAALYNECVNICTAAYQVHPALITLEVWDA